MRPAEATFSMLSRVAGLERPTHTVVILDVRFCPITGDICPPQPAQHRKQQIPIHGRLFCHCAQDGVLLERRPPRQTVNGEMSVPGHSIVFLGGLSWSVGACPPARLLGKTSIWGP